ncbi:hypothetical protein [Flammeovirga sp. SJP92]|uniref:hypothetical protein n=1 Tax=Flammeovirga sp. SJP92 TaxID=1775430 RepID=UPI0012FB885B|nr:hypothetical protein [Flammeovirga sp. SJP92]
MTNLSKLLLLVLFVISPYLGYSQFHTISDLTLLKFEEKGTDYMYHKKLITDKGSYTLYSTLNKEQQVFLSFVPKNSSKEITINIKNIEVYVGYQSNNAMEYVDLIADYRGDIWLFYSAYSSTKHRLFRKKVNIEKKGFDQGTLVAERMLINNNKGGDRNNKSVNFNIIQSESKKYLSVITFFNNEKEKCTNVFIDMINENWKKEWKMSPTLSTYFSNPQNNLPNKINIFKEKNLQVFNDGTLYGIQKLKNSSEKKDHYFSLYVFKKGEEQALVHTIRHEDKNIEDLRFIQNDNNNLIIAGYYDFKKSKVNNKIEGLYFMNLDLTKKEILTETFTPFTRENIRDLWLPMSRPHFEDQKDFTKLQKELTREFESDPNYKLDDGFNISNILQQANNTYTLISENYSMNGGSRKGIQYINVNEYGKINWIKNHFRYHFINVNFPFSETLKVFNMDDSILMFYLDGNKLLSAEISMKGDTNFNIVFDPDSNKIYKKNYIYPGTIERLSSTDFIMHAFSRKIIQSQKTFTLKIGTPKEQ